MFLLVTLTHVLSPVIWLLHLLLAFQFCYCWNWYNSYLQSVTYPVDVQCHRITDMSSQVLHNFSIVLSADFLALSWTFEPLPYPSLCNVFVVGSFSFLQVEFYNTFLPVRAASNLADLIVPSTMQPFVPLYWVTQLLIISKSGQASSLWLQCLVPALVI